ncbi:hypothetical protein OH77DRAFT_502718 [Trametes cingulata]|nr:hypothetical protein OH77DRAFT_502718 [Trametes cingulata]
MVESLDSEPVRVDSWEVDVGLGYVSCWSLGDVRLSLASASITIHVLHVSHLQHTVSLRWLSDHDVVLCLLHRLPDPSPSIFRACHGGRPGRVESRDTRRRDVRYTNSLTTHRRHLAKQTHQRSQRPTPTPHAADHVCGSSVRIDTCWLSPLSLSCTLYKSSRNALANALANVSEHLIPSSAPQHYCITVSLAGRITGWRR